MDEKKRKLEATDGGEEAENGAETSAPVGAEEAESLRHMLSLFSKEQLSAILMDAALAHESVRGAISGVANKDVSQRKLFVRGLSWETTTEDLLPVFAAYGEVEEGAVVTDKTTGKSRGFAFVTFKDILGAHRALKEPSKKVQDRMTTCNLAALGGSNAQASSAVTGVRPGATQLLAAPGTGGAPSFGGLPGGDVAMRKVYVWGLANETSTESFLAFFARFGEIEEGAVTYEKVTRQSRGFGFVTYKTAEAAKKAIDEPIKPIDGKNVSAKYAAEGSIKEKMKKQQAASPYGLLPTGSSGFPGYQQQHPPAQAPASFFGYQQQPQGQGMYGVPQMGGYQMPGAMGGYPVGMPGISAAPAGGAGAAGGGAGDPNAAAMAAYNAQLAAYAAATAMSQHQQGPSQALYGGAPAGGAPAAGGGILGSSTGSAAGAAATPAAAAAPAAQYAAAAAAQYAAQLAQYQSSQGFQ